jgi:hypothetical protein
MGLFIELKDFLNKYKKPNITFREFFFSYKVKGIKGIVLLKDFVKTKNISIKHLFLLYNFIIHIEEYLTRFYNHSLKIKKKQITDEPMDIINNSKKSNYKNIIRNMFYEELLSNTKSGLSKKSFLIVIEDLLNGIIDKYIMTDNAYKYLNEGRFATFLFFYYFRSSILNPFLIYSLNYNSFKKDNAKVLSTTLGWGSYFYGFAEYGISYYCGIDVIPTVCNKVKEFSYSYPNITTDIRCIPSEELINDNKFLQQYNKFFDIIFFSPPYYKLELYEGENQSITQYTSYEDWLEKYWHNTIKLCSKVIKEDGVMCYVIGNYKKYNLIEDMNNITNKYFLQTDKINMGNKKFTEKTKNNINEYIFIFKLISISRL